MGFSEGQLVLDSPNGTYYSGQPVYGKLIFREENVKSFRGLYVKMKGFCRVHWTTHHTHMVNGQPQPYTISHDSHEEYVNCNVYMLGGESGVEQSLQPGDYEFPFHFRLPPNSPSSFEGKAGHVRYKVKAVFERGPFKINEKKKVAVRVMAPLDLNLDPICREPIQMELRKEYYFCFMKKGSSEVLVRTPASGYCPGQTMPVEVTCTNTGKVEINNITLRIVKKITFIAKSVPGQIKVVDNMVEFKLGPVLVNSKRSWSVAIDIPAMDVYNLTECQYIKMETKLHVLITPKGMHTSFEDSRNIVIGTIPLAGFGGIRTPLQGQLDPQSLYPHVIDAYPKDGNTPKSLENPLDENSRFPNHHIKFGPVGLQSRSAYPENPPPYSNNSTDLTKTPFDPSEVSHDVTNITK